MAEHDAIIVGSGVNSLACGAFLARAGWRVAVLERESELGGAVRTAELTEPGFHHDVFSAWHPLWVGGPAHAELARALAERGLEYLNTVHPTGTLPVTAMRGGRRSPPSPPRRSSSSESSEPSSGLAQA